MATVYSLVCENGKAGSYWSGLSAADRLRYGAPGSERVYDGLAAWSVARASASDTSPFTKEVCEIGDAFTEFQTAELDLGFTKALCEITTLIDGIRTDGFHGGVIGAGYILDRTRNTNGTALNVPPLSVVDGFTVKISSTGYNPTPIGLTNLQATAKRMIAIGNSRPYWGFYVTGAAATAEYCLAVGFTGGAGFSVSYRNPAQTIKNCISVKNKQGFDVGGGDFEGFFYNNIAIGNITNWDNDATIRSNTVASNNMGEDDGADSFVGGSPWTTGTNPNYAGTTSDFVNYGSSSFSYDDDFNPANSTVIQVGNGVPYYQILTSDLSGKPVPSYNPTGDENVDIGCYEYDYGNGLAPQIVPINISGIAEGSEMAVYKADDKSEIVPPTTIGAGGTYTGEYSYTGDTPVIIRVRKGTSGTRYEPYTAPGVITGAGLSVVVSQVEVPIE